MAHFEAKMTSKGQLTVPAGLRQALRLEAGDIVDFYLLDDGRVEVIARNKPLSEMIGCLQEYGVPGTSLADYDDAVADALADDDERVKRQYGRSTKAPAAE